MKCRVSEVASGTVGLPRGIADQLSNPGEVDVERVEEGLLLRPVADAESAERYAERWAAYFDSLPAGLGFTEAELRELKREQERIQAASDERVLELFAGADCPPVQSGGRALDD